MKLIHEFNGLLGKDGDSKPLKIRISEPIRNISHGDHYCVVLTVPLLRTEKKIFGVAAEQAADLAVSFTKELLADWTVLDESGDNIDPTDLFN